MSPSRSGRGERRVFRDGDGRMPRPRLPSGHPPMRPLPLILLAALLSVSACASAEREGDRVVLAIDAPPETLDRRMALGLNAMRIAQLVTPGLTRIDESGRAVPDLAASFEADGERSWIFRLREGLVFSDGTPLQ